MTLSIGVLCYATFGGSGVVATEIGLAMARRGHRVHFVGSEPPFRLGSTTLPDGVAFHRVRPLDYPLFPQTPYTLALASALVEVARRERLDLVHAHYAVPHAAAAWMARDVLDGRLGVVATLHGTDITLVGTDPAYLPVTRHAILKSDLVTAPSAFLARETHERFDLSPERVPVEVVPNFVDTAVYRPFEGPRLRTTALFGERAARVPVVGHVSNFRPLKRIDRVVEVFARVAATRDALLLLVGDGPERPAAERWVLERGLGDRVRFVGAREEVAPWVRECAVFLLPSETESFGLAALEALASGVPVVAHATGGLPEVVRDGVTGFLVAPGDVEALAARLGALLDDPARRGAMGRAARADAVERFDREPLVDRWERLYARALEVREEGRA